MNFDQVLNTVIGLVFSAIVVHIVKGYIAGLKDSLKDHQDLTSKKFNKIEERLDKLQDGYANVFNEILSKFSSWEDRIKSILDKLVKENFNGSLSDMSKYVDSEMKMVDSKVIVESIKNEMKELEKDLNSMSTKMNDSEFKLQKLDNRTRENFYDLLKYTKNSIYDMKQKIIKIEYLLSNDLIRMNDLISKLYLITKKLNQDLIKSKIDIYKKFELQKTRIRLK
ncbi:MAG: hypothetical protein COT84_02015 [Chlamydiae bacterium CG10_big_fil_rev_8_21_14_0_10_35_9]|nr:MAG: hypothetical protein COT84_02015 [Chlamydiae bacterium CG10_big_fil_rev_8_21_14_0_10_35_9]